MQEAHDSAAGSLRKCKACGKDNVVPDSDLPDMGYVEQPERLDMTYPDLTYEQPSPAISKQVLIIAGAVVFALVFLIVAIGIAVSRDSKQTATAPPDTERDRDRVAQNSRDSKTTTTAPPATERNRDPVAQEMWSVIVVGVIGSLLVVGAIVGLLLLIYYSSNACPYCKKGRSVVFVRSRVIATKRCYGLVTRYSNSSFDAWSKSGDSTHGYGSSSWKERVPVIRELVERWYKCRHCHAKWTEEEEVEREDFDRR
jgi:hypothetical protein